MENVVHFMGGEQMLRREVVAVIEPNVCARGGRHVLVTKTRSGLARRFGRKGAWPRNTRLIACRRRRSD